MATTNRDHPFLHQARAIAGLVLAYELYAHADPYWFARPRPQVHTITFINIDTRVLSIDSLEHEVAHATLRFFPKKALDLVFVREGDGAVPSNWKLLTMNRFWMKQRGDGFFGPGYMSGHTLLKYFDECLGADLRLIYSVNPWLSEPAEMTETGVVRHTIRPTNSPEEYIYEEHMLKLDDGALVSVPRHARTLIRWSAEDPSPSV